MALEIHLSFYGLTSHVGEVLGPLSIIRSFQPLFEATIVLCVHENFSQELGLGQPLNKWQILSINHSLFLKGKRKGIKEGDLQVGK